MEPNYYQENMTVGDQLDMIRDAGRCVIRTSRFGYLLGRRKGLVVSE